MTGERTSWRLDAAVRERFQVSWGKARDWIATGKVWLDGRAATDPGLSVGDPGALELRMNAPRAAARAPGPDIPEPEVVHSDTQLIVVNKPAGMSTVPYGERERDSLEQWVCRRLGQPRVGIVHRVDRETSGLVVFARTREAEKALANQFRFHTVIRRYFALAHGRVQSRVIRSLLVENRGDGLRGSIPPGGGHSRDEAKPAVTHVTALRHLDGMTLVECRLETGRTHQIRIHLSEAGHPLVGEKAYIREHAGPRIEAPRMMLHAGELGVIHPARGVPVRWTRLPPRDFLGMIGSAGEALLAERLR